MFRNKNNNPRLILAKLRRGDYAHAGETEAIDIVLDKIKYIDTQNLKKINTKILDVGCGLGGTAEYIKNKTSYEVYGIDIDEASLNHAKKHYPDIRFFLCDSQSITSEISKEKFDIIYMFNVFYAFQNQRKALEELSKISKQGTILAIFDYTQAEKNSFELKDFSEKEMNPIYLKDLAIWLKETNWELIEIADLSDKYKQWYADFLNQFQKNKNKLLEEFTEEAVDKVDKTFSLLLNKIEDKKMGGSIIYARRK